MNRFGKPSDRYSGGNFFYRMQSRSKAVTMEIQFSGRKRFCETCQSLKPRGNRPAIKGWKCDDCKSESTQGAEGKTIATTQEQETGSKA